MIQKLLSAIKKGLKSLQATKFRSYLILLYYIVITNDGYDSKKMELILTILSYDLNQNIKYFSETDIIHQWIMKLVIASPVFKQAMIRTPEGAQLINQIIQRIQLLKKPTLQILKKQRNPTYQRLNYQIHGLIVSPDLQDYQKLYQSKKAFFLNLFHQKPLPHDIVNPNKLIIYIQPEFQQLTHRIQPGQIILYLNNKKWSRMLVKENKYGMLYMNKIIKDMNKNIIVQENIGNIHKKQVNPGSHFIKVHNKIVDIGEDCKLHEDQLMLFQADQRIRFIGDVKKNIEIISKNKGKGKGLIGHQNEQNTKNKTGKGIKGLQFKEQKMDEQPDSSSDLSYQSSYQSHGQSQESQSSQSNPGK